MLALRSKKVKHSNEPRGRNNGLNRPGVRKTRCTKGTGRDPSLRQDDENMARAVLAATPVFCLVAAGARC